ncbi:conserved hypothetical protein [Burkholderia cenocepacia]|nr:conserved hypothetical protein [Burkholderia cenocepacia]
MHIQAQLSQWPFTNYCVNGHFIFSVVLFNSKNKTEIFSDS